MWTYYKNKYFQKLVDIIILIFIILQCITYTHNNHRITEHIIKSCQILIKISYTSEANDRQVIVIYNNGDGTVIVIKLCFR